MAGKRKGDADLTTQDGNSPRGAGRRPGTGRVLTGIQNTHEHNQHEPMWTSHRYTPADKPLKNIRVPMNTRCTEEGAESDGAEDVSDEAGKTQKQGVTAQDLLDTGVEALIASADFATIDRLHHYLGKLQPAVLEAKRKMMEC